jgi:NAD-dependent deacetylase
MPESEPARAERRVGELLRSARHVAVLTGAGISAESGVPTFRDAITGFWERFRPEDLATPEAFQRNPDLVWRWYRERRLRLGSVAPNPGHHALVELARRVPRLTLVTQNVDGLHTRAGSRDVIELHGSLSRVVCFEQRHPALEFADTEAAPRCTRCNSLLRPDVVWFGELLPLEALARAQEAARSCEVFLSIGTSNLVEPAASLPWLAARRGAEVIVVNTTMEGQGTGPTVHHLIGPAGRMLPELLRAAWPD